MDSSLKALHRNLAEWIAGPAGAVIFHVLLILLVLLLVDFSREPPPDDPYEITMLDLKDPPPLDPPPPETLNTDPLHSQQSEPAFPQWTDMDFPEPDPGDLILNESVAVLEPPTIEPVISPICISGLIAGGHQSRIGVDARARSGEQYGDKWFKYTEVSVVKALEWLRINQNKDGSWGTHDREAMTGLALLTFLAHGETTGSESYGETVANALHYLVGVQKADGSFAKADTTAGTYSQAICTYAVSEAFGMTRILGLRPVMEGGVQVLIDGQQSGGGFDYRFAKGPRRDTSLGGWCSQALKAAYIAGASNPGLRQAMELAVGDMKSAQQQDGRFLYSSSSTHASENMTAVAVLCLQLMGHGEESAARKGLAALRDADCKWSSPPEWPMYAWYYISQCKFHQGGDHWTRWNNQFAPQFIRNQNPDGSWTSAGLGLKEGAAGRENMHPVYATTLAALTLQVYYRNLPTYQSIEKQAAEPEQGEVKIEIL